ncbi:helix-turn-helix transcriptional regulator [Chengkuizengella axinellae]|uniref:Helix-turn-helix transcriptional regulator n=1 Tax=Chengkuizengella axinellae TaxID=3064388 RepID=A0ABT9J4R9_9BACL|nr:helix-turn-helix transcriptional regulator [Chengkuizengella sp. 2205SS18-9]MDP5275985.1 helix-turn-helix transcriptional regulator [Chengkuizengella sp. 2205SS18-9]
METGEKIRWIRKFKNLTQGELVEGIASVTYISRVETGRVEPSPSFLNKVSKKLGITSEYLTNTLNENRNKLRQLILNYKNNVHLLNESDLFYLQMSALEMHSQNDLTNIYGILISYYTINNHLDEAEKLVGRSVKLISNKNIDKRNFPHFFYYNKAIGNYYYAKQFYEDAKFYYSIAERYITDETSIESGHLYYNYSLVYQQIFEEINISLIYTNKALQIYKMHNHEENIIKTMILLAQQYRDLHRIEDALSNLKKAQKLLLEHELNHILYSEIQYNIGKVYQKINKDTHAIQYFKSTLQISQPFIQTKLSDMNGSVPHIKIYAYACKGLVEVLYKQKDWEDVQFYFSTAFDISCHHHLPHLYIELKAIKANIYKYKENHIFYEKEMKEAIQYALDHKHYVITKKLATELGDYYFENKYYKKSVDYYRLARNHTQNILDSSVEFSSVL